MFELSESQTEFQRKRRASDRVSERAARAADHGDTAAMRIAGSQLELLLRERAAYRRPGTAGGARRRSIGEVG